MKLRITLVSALLLMLAFVGLRAETTAVSGNSPPRSVAPGRALDEGALVADPFLGISEIVTTAPEGICIGCIDEPSHCKSKGHDAGKPCGTGSPPNACLCSTCNGVFSCWPP
jgi:hypothetical protein